ncbi:MAG: GTP 3',8-cyclase MoaA [Betaproteobacteria bacterium]|nr:MAG: GTP 3',8-cyclase MoaA [Betaproteobacteria bacterium]
MPSVLDTRGRVLRNLRVSVTDRCNLRCGYCMPEEEYVWLPREDILHFGEIAALADVFLDLGVDKVRLTGGEPLLRRDLPRLVTMLAALPGIDDLALTTNGLLLARDAAALRAAGLQRVTVSLHSLRPATFDRLSGGRGQLPAVLAGIDAAANAGLTPIKVNAVVVRGVNDDEVAELARFFKRPGFVLRFIEYMDVGHTNGWRLDDVVPSAEIIRIVGHEFPLEPIGANYPGEVAERWRYLDSDEAEAGEIGVISSVTHAFCKGCTRARLATDGKLYTCLFATQGYDLRALLRGSSADEEIINYLAAIWSQRADRYSEIRSERTAALPKIEMSYIGG